MGANEMLAISSRRCIFILIEIYTSSLTPFLSTILD